MAGLNKVILIGNLGRDPELRYTQSGTAVANFTLATNEAWTNRNGEREERTEWHRIVAWAKLAEFCGEYLSKGRQIYIEGRLQTRDWEDKEGNKRYTTEIKADKLLLLGSRPAEGSHPSGGEGSRPDEGSRPGGSPPASTGGDDIPF